MASLSKVNFWATLLLLGSAVSAIAATPLPSPPSHPSYSLVSSQLAPLQLSQSQTTEAPQPRLTQAIQRDLAQRLNVAPTSIQIISTTPVTWPDQCLGLARANERCRGGELPGWRIEVASAQQYWTYRSDRSGKQFRLEPLAGADSFAQGELTPAASQTLLKTVARQVKRPMGKLQIRELQATTWDGCLGIFIPDRACTMIAIFGFRAVISDGNATWVYHLSEDASQIAQNSTASGAHGKVIVSFMPMETEPVSNPNVDPKTVFRSVVSGDLSGSVSITALLEDGTLYQETSSQRGGTKLQRTLLRKLSASEVKAFQILLEKQRFPNLNRMRYISEVVFADYPTTRLDMPGMAVDYVDLELAHLPRPLRNIVKAWQALQP